MSDKKLTVEEFVQRALRTLPGENRQGFHTVFSGFNEAFRTYFPGLNPVEETQALANKGVIVLRLARRGAMIFPAGTEMAESGGKQALGKMGLK